MGFSVGMKRKRDPIINEAISRVGTLAKFAKACGITVQAVCLWSHVPINQVLKVERVTGIPREQLRPDIFGAPRPRPQTRASNAAA